MIAATTLRGGQSTLGDAVDDLLKKTEDPDNKIRIAAFLQLGKLAQRDTLDKRALPAMYEHIVDTDGAVRTIVASALGIPGWVDALVDPCLRTNIAQRLIAMSQREPSAAARAAQIRAAELLQELGLVDTSPEALRRCEAGGTPITEQPVDVGPFVDPSQAPASGLSAGAKVALMAAALTSTALVAYVFWPRDRVELAGRKPTIYEALRDKLGREPTSAELRAEVERIKSEAHESVASRGGLPYQRRRRR